MKSYFYLILKLVLLDLELSIRGFNNTFEHYTKRYESIRSPFETELDLKKELSEVEILFEKLDIICTWYPRKSDCIHKTFLGYKIIRSKFHIPVDMNIGVRKFPFEAHAWITCYNQNFFDDKEETDKYNIILSSNKEGEKN